MNGSLYIQIQAMKKGRRLRWDSLCLLFFFFFFFFFISWRLITLQYCSGFCHTLTSISHRFACVPHPNTPSHLPSYPISLLYLQSRSFFPLANSCDFSITYKFSKHRFISYFPEISDTVNLK